MYNKHTMHNEFPSNIISSSLPETMFTNECHLNLYGSYTRIYSV